MRAGIGIVSVLALAISANVAVAGGRSRLLATAEPGLAGVLKERPPPLGTEREPYHAVRTLSALQERIAQGDETAFALQKSVVADIAAELKTFPADAWRDVRNRQSLIKFALSGGDPEMLRAIVESKQFSDAELPLALGALSYAEGKRSAALRHLDKVDVFALPPSLGGHVALVKAIVVADADLAQVVRLCDSARLLSPGTLVEETALRLAIEATVAQGNRAKFESLAVRYFRRFPRSPYLTAVIRSAAAVIVDAGHGERPEGAKWVHSVVQFLDPTRMVQFYSALAGISLSAGMLTTTAQAARMATKYARSGSPEHAVAQTYEGAALVIGSEGKKGLALLDAAEAAGVPPPTSDLITSARAIAKMIQSPPQPVLMPVSVLHASAAVDTAPAKTAAAAPPRSPSATRALARMNYIDKLLEDID